jgi:Helix-turn-helix domain of resolvase/HNH endonuclease
MKLPFCVACLAKEDLQHHHLLMRSEGGGSEEANLITLCTACHYKLHQRQVGGTYNHSQRRLEGIARAKATGVRFGRPRKMTLHQRQEAIRRLQAGETQADVARTYNVTAATICRMAASSPFAPAGAGQ